MTRLDPISLARSFLFVPASRPERFAKALASGAGAVIIDLEDAVAPHAKPAAREQLAQAWAGFSMPERARLVIRINAAGTPWHKDDQQLVAGLAAAGLGGVVLPKAESVAMLDTLAAHAGAVCALLPMVETAAGLVAVDALAACPRVCRLVFGNLDFQADVGMVCGPDEAELAPVRLALVLASRRAGLVGPVDGVTASISNTAQLQQDSQRSRRFGFGARLCIHPTQVAAVNSALAPSDQEVDWAQRVLAHSQHSASGVFTLDGRMVDAPVLRLAQHTLALTAGR
jgi:citrate lyase subunit beta/citryl-CoA lyase